jgi:hypothetical protein
MLPKLKAQHGVRDIATKIDSHRVRREEGVAQEEQEEEEQRESDLQRDRK